MARTQAGHRSSMNLGISSAAWVACKTIGHSLKAICNSPDRKKSLFKAVAAEINRQYEAHQSTTRHTFFQEFRWEEKNLSEEQVAGLAALTKGWELNDDDLEELRKSAQLWASKPWLFFDTRKPDRPGTLGLIQFCFNDIEQIENVNLTRLISKVFSDVVEASGSPSKQETKKRRRKLKRQSASGSKWAQIVPRWMVLALQGATAKRFEDRHWQPIEIKAINAYVKNIVGVLRPRFEINLKKRPQKQSASRVELGKGATCNGNGHRLTQRSFLVNEDAMGETNKLVGYIPIPSWMMGTYHRKASKKLRAGYEIWSGEMMVLSTRFLKAKFQTRFRRFSPDPNIGPGGSGAVECHNDSFSKQVHNGRQLSPIGELSLEEREAAQMLQQFQQQTQPTSDPPSSQQLGEMSVRNATRECSQDHTSSNDPTTLNTNESRPPHPATDSNLFYNGETTTDIPTWHNVIFDPDAQDITNEVSQNVFYGLGTHNSTNGSWQDGFFDPDTQHPTNGLWRNVLASETSSNDSMGFRQLLPQFPYCGGLYAQPSGF
ncbi:predicted protein [Histoplasma mississippiense (nom. inval.)]|uniref:predicted protein n=1 Tax=Ajellomyces capsulatus (strain NAm1 / WU24) TaxID=2059318 RepID=UPI000157C441|nr:predicted protein [Histoplasma mississippiense (nom. inval.)]EDN08465.1 predicted protein [Histoplasma mississippiense (nom. inval.)]